jgi:hypothetical protein
VAHHAAARAIRELQMWQYRAAIDEEDLEALFRLRYRAFSASETLHEVVAGSSQNIDVTAWDLVSVHHGIFADGVAVAAIRAVSGEPTLQSGTVEALAARLGLAPPRQPAVRYPMLAHIASGPLSEKIASQRDQGLAIVECGRLCIEPGLGPATSSRAFRFLAECTLAAELLVGRTDVMYGLSPPKLARIYRAYGFERVKEADEVLAFSTRVRGVLSVLTREQLLAQPIAPRVRRYSDELKRSGSVRRGELPLIDAA